MVKTNSKSDIWLNRYQHLKFNYLKISNFVQAKANCQKGKDTDLLTTDHYASDEAKPAIHVLERGPRDASCFSAAEPRVSLRVGLREAMSHQAEQGQTETFPKKKQRNLIWPTFGLYKSFAGLLALMNELENLLDCRLLTTLDRRLQHACAYMK